MTKHFIDFRFNATLNIYYLVGFVCFWYVVPFSPFFFFFFFIKDNHLNFYPALVTLHCLLYLFYFPDNLHYFLSNKSPVFSPAVITNNVQKYRFCHRNRTDLSQIECGNTLLCFGQYLSLAYCKNYKIYFAAQDMKQSYKCQ